MRELKIEGSLEVGKGSKKQSFYEKNKKSLYPMYHNRVTNLMFVFFCGIC